MQSDVIYMSAPFDLRGIGSADFDWEVLRPYQPLLGHDAQMAEFADIARQDGVKVRILAAPEIYGTEEALKHLRKGVADNVLGHFRFGSPSLPRLLKHELNIVVLAEDTSIPTLLGRHPFAAGAALPAGAGGLLIYDRTTPVPERIGKEPVPCFVLPPNFANLGMPSENGTNFCGNFTLQSCNHFRSEAWIRSAPLETNESPEIFARGPAVLLPWNLSAAGSLVPDILKKASLLAAQSRLPVTIVTLPYNDSPNSIALLGKVANACAERSGHLGSAAICFARAGSIWDSFALIRKCKRAWIDTSDPEWRWTLKRVGSCRLPINFISELPQELANTYEQGCLGADELVTKEMTGRFGHLFWRTRVLSLRQLERLTRAIAEELDVPFRPIHCEIPTPTRGLRLRDLVRRIERGSNG